MTDKEMLEILDKASKGIDEMNNFLRNNDPDGWYPDHDKRGLLYKKNRYLMEYQIDRVPLSFRYRGMQETYSCKRALKENHVIPSAYDDYTKSYSAYIYAPLDQERDCRSVVYKFIKFTPKIYFPIAELLGVTPSDVERLVADEEKRIADLDARVKALPKNEESNNTFSLANIASSILGEFLDSANRKSYGIDTRNMSNQEKFQIFRENSIKKS